MLGPNDAVMLVDFDCAGMADPHYDIGVLLNEACQSEAEMHTGLDLAFGRDDPRDLNRCRLHAFADDVFWGLWGLAMAATSPRQGLEFLKYGEWRLLRARMFHGDGAFPGRLHQL
jgi:thiamine kinase-like enzyme